MSMLDLDMNRSVEEPDATWRWFTYFWCKKNTRGCAL